MADGSAPSPASGRQVAPEDVWEAVKEDYVDGLSAAQCCRRHGVGRSALYKRAAAQKWRRVDLPWTPPAMLDAEDEGVALAARVDGDIDRIEFHELAFVAQARMMRARSAGRRRGGAALAPGAADHGRRGRRDGARTGP